MEELKIRQKTLYDSHTVRPGVFKIAVDESGFAFGIRLKEKKLKKILISLGIEPQAAVLDIGCREGRFLNKLNAQYGAQGIGVDISNMQLQENAKNNPFANIYCAADAEAMPFRSNVFDFVFCFDVFEHLPNPHKCLSEISRVLKPKGRALIYAINSKDKYTWHWFLRKISLSKIGVDKGEFEDHDRDNFIRIEDIAASSKAQNLHIEKVIFFHAFFTLAFDEAWPVILRFMHRKTVSKAATNSAQENCMPPGMRISSYFTDLVMPFLEFLDKPWAGRGFSNGFFVILRKEI